MQKLKVILLSIFCISLCLLSGCKSLPGSKSTSVNPIELLDSQGFIYFSIPKNFDEDLFNNFLKNNGISNPKQITKNIDSIYICLNQNDSNDFLQLQGVIQGRIPVSFVEKNLQNKSDLKEIQLENHTYKIYKINEIEFSFPSNKVVLFGKDILPMLQKFDDFSFGDFEEDDLIDYEISSFLLENNSEIRMGCKDISNLFSLLEKNTSLELNIEYLKASIYPDLYNKNFYLIDLSLTFKNEMFMKAGKSILSMLLTENAVKIETEEKNLLIKGYPLKKEILYSLSIF